MKRFFFTFFFVNTIILIMLLSLWILFVLLTIRKCKGLATENPIILPKTSAVLRITYDGRLFHGWTAANDGSLTNLPIDNNNVSLNKRSRSRRNRNRPSIQKGEVRSVQGTIRAALAKLYGNVNAERVIVEGTSRTDAGVSARHMIALVYCLHDESCQEDERYRGTLSIEGKRLPHPTCPTDNDFKPLPFGSDLRQMLFALNKMLPPDVRVSDASTMPIPNVSDVEKIPHPFHPSLDSISKTYVYTFSIGELYDPLQSGHVWHIVHAKSFNISRAQECANILCGKHDFVAFKGAFRGNERGKIQNTVCNVQSITIEHDNGNKLESSLPSCNTYKVTVTGDRFLYKMVRFLVGTIVQYGTDDERSLEEINHLFNDDLTPNPRLCAPSNGLVLDHVDFGNKWIFNWTIAE